MCLSLFEIFEVQISIELFISSFAVERIISKYENSLREKIAFYVLRFRKMLHRVEYFSTFFGTAYQKQ